MIPLRTLLLPAMVVAGAATWAWSQSPTPVPVTNDRELRAKTLQINNSVFTAPLGAPPAAGNGVAGFQAGSSGNVSWAVDGAPGTPGYRLVTRPRTVMETYYITLQPEELAEQKEVQSLTDILHSDKSAEEKEKAKTSLSAILQKQFTRDVERREKEVAELEERVKKLRNQLDKRKEAKDKIISLRLTTIQNEAEGLGFPEEGRGGGGAALNLLENPIGRGQPVYGGTFPQPVPAPSQLINR